MNRMKIIEFVSINSAFAASIYLGFFEGVEGAKNIAYFWAWFTIVVSVFALTEHAQAQFKKDGRSVPIRVVGTLKALFTLVLVYSGALVTGVFYAISSLIFVAGIKEAFKERGQSD